MYANKNNLLLALLLTAAGSAHAQYTEKYPTEIPRQAANAAFVTAAKLKLDEIATGQIIDLINNPSTQVRMAPSAVLDLTDLRNSALSNEHKAYEFLAAVNEDIGSNSTPATPAPLSVSIGFSPKHNVARITWQRDIVENSQCLTQEANLSNRPFNLSEEAEYQILRNGRLITKISAGFAVSNDYSARAPKINFGFVTLRLRFPVPNAPDFTVQNGDPVFYDFDPYQGNVGTPLRYEIYSWRKGCVGAGGILYGNLGGLQRSGQITVDSNGDSRPDFITLADWQSKLNEPSRGKFAYASGGYYSNVSSLIVKNVGRGVLENVSVSCTAGGGRILQQPSSTIAPGATASIVTFHNTSSGSYCRPAFIGSNAKNTGFIPDIAY